MRRLVLIGNDDDLASRATIERMALSVVLRETVVSRHVASDARQSSEAWRVGRIVDMQSRAFEAVHSEIKPVCLPNQDQFSRLIEQIRVQRNRAEITSLFLLAPHLLPLSAD